MKSTAMRTVSALTTKQSISRKKRPSWEELPLIKSAKVEGATVTVELKDKRLIQFPVAWSKPLSKATALQRKQLRVTAYHIFWDEIDEVIGIENILYGNKLFL